METWEWMWAEANFVIRGNAMFNDIVSLQVCPSYSSVQYKAGSFWTMSWATKQWQLVWNVRYKPSWLHLIIDASDAMHVGPSLVEWPRAWKIFGATKVSGPKKAMHFWKVHYLPLITWGAVYPGAWAYTCSVISRNKHYHQMVFVTTR